MVEHARVASGMDHARPRARHRHGEQVGEAAAAGGGPMERLHQVQAPSHFHVDAHHGRQQVLQGHQSSIGPMMLPDKERAAAAAWAVMPVRHDKDWSPEHPSAGPRALACRCQGGNTTLTRDRGDLFHYVTDTVWIAAKGGAIMSVYLLSLFLMVVYAWNRFNTPATARSSTRQTLYWASCSGYVACMLGLFVVLSFALELDAVRAALLGKGADGGKAAGNAPSALLAMLVLTAMLPSLPLVKQADAWLLDLFHELGSIPAEVSRRAAQLTPGAFRVSPQDVAALARFIEQSELPDSLTAHLRGDEPDGLERSQFRFTRVAKLYMRLSELRASPRYARFFSGAQAEWSILAASFGTFARRSDAVLTLAEKLRDAEGRSVYEELVSEKRESYRLECLTCFQPLAQFLARAVLRSEGGEREVVRALRDVGFDATPVTDPEFPVQSLAGLVLLMLALFLVVSGPLSSLIPPPPRSAGAPRPT